MNDQQIIIKDHAALRVSARRELDTANAPDPDLIFAEIDEKV